MDILRAQQDMRHAYIGGSTGLFASALVWLCAASVSVFVSTGTAVWALIIGGMLIHPLAMVFAKMLGRSDAHSKDNPLGALALETTVYMLFGIATAFIISTHHVEWFFPAMLLVIGGRYLTFATLYGMRIYWACGAALAASGFLVFFFQQSATVGALAGGLIELLFAVIIFSMVRHEKVQPLRNTA